MEGLETNQGIIDGQEHVQTVSREEPYARRKIKKKYKKIMRNRRNKKNEIKKLNYKK